MKQAHLSADIDLTPWTPTPEQLPDDWIALAGELAEQAECLLPMYILRSRYDAQQVGKYLHCWGLPWQVVIASYLLECDEEHIRRADLNDVDVEQVLNHIREARLYVQDIENENLPSLLTPPYRDLGALLIATVASYRALRTLQLESNGQPYTGKKQSHIESVGRTLLNIAKRLGMWWFKREIEDLIEQLRSYRRFVEAERERARILKQDKIMLEDARQLLTMTYREATNQPITIILTECGIVGLRRRLQDAHTTATSRKVASQLTGFDLVTFEVIVPTVRDCYTAFGMLSQLGYIQDRVTDLIANPKPNGCSHIALGLILNPQSPYTKALKWPETYTRICQLQIATRFMHAITWYGCLHPSYYQLYVEASLQKQNEPPQVKQLWSEEKGKVFLTTQEDLDTGRAHPESKAPIVVYDSKSRKPFYLSPGATALDFAYTVDSRMGERAVEAFINNRKAPLYRILDAGDIVEISTSGEPQADYYWLDHQIATTPGVRRQIKESLEQRFPDHRGYKMLQQELERYHFMLTAEELDYELRRLLDQNSLGTPQEYLGQLVKISEDPYTPAWAAQGIMQQIMERDELFPARSGRASWVPVLDMKLTKNKQLFHRQLLCNECQPTYPHDMRITGLLHRRRRELVVHKDSCAQIINHRVGYRPALLPLTWQIQPPAFRVAFIIEAQDRQGLVHDITRQLRRHLCDLLYIQGEAIFKFGSARISLTIETHADKEALDIWQELSRIDNVTSVEINARATPAFTRERLEKLREQGAAFPNQTASEPTGEEASWTQQRRDASRFLDNPYDISRPARPSMFFGRSKELELMEDELCESDQGKALMLYGPRRSGKSSICTNFLSLRVRPPRWGVLFSLQNATQHNEDTILIQLADKIGREFNKQLKRPALNWQHYSDSDPEVRFRRLLQDYLVQIPGTRLILALDEFGGALESYRRGILEHRFFTYWKELMNEVDQLSLIFVLPTSAHYRLYSGDLTHAFSFAKPLLVPFLDTESARLLLTEPLQKQNIGIFPNTVALATKFTGRNPYYMTLIGQQLMYLLKFEQWKERLTDRDLLMVVNQITRNTGNFNHNFSFLYDELQNRDELRILEVIVELTRRSNQAQVQLKKIATRLGLSQAEAKQHLHRLCNGLILLENDPSSNPHYAFTIELVHRWLDHNRWFFAPKWETSYAR